MPDQKPRPSRSPITFGNVEAGSLRVQPIMHIAQTISDLGADPDMVFAATGIPADLFADPENTISFQALGTLLEHCVAATGCDHFGLQLGASAGANPLGLLSEIMGQCADVGTAIAYFQQNLHLHDRGALATRTIEGRDASLGYVVFVGEIAGIELINDVAVAVGVVLMRALCGPEWQPTAIHLPRCRPDNLHPYQKFFGCLPQFDAERAALYFPARDLKRKIAGADPGKFAVLEEDLKSIAELHDLVFVEKVQRIVSALVTLRRCSLDEVAGQLSMNRRRVNRLLEREGTTYHRIAQETLRVHAERLMVNTDMTLGKIAAALGYADASAFTRAFRTWHGCSPQAWRRENAQRADSVSRSVKRS